MPIGGSCRRQVIVGILDANSSPVGRSGSSDSIHRKCLRSCAPPRFSETSAWRAGQNSCSLVATRPVPTSSMNAVATRPHVAGIRCCSRTTMPSTSCCQWRSSSAGSSTGGRTSSPCPQVWLAVRSNSHRSAPLTGSDQLPIGEPGGPLKHQPQEMVAVVGVQVWAARSEDRLAQALLGAFEGEPGPGIGLVDRA
jgi:hypothetical protein